MALPITFQIPVIFPSGDSGSSSLRRLLELKALDEMILRVKERGYIPVSETFQIYWVSPYQGEATMMALPRDTIS